MDLVIIYSLTLNLSSFDDSDITFTGIIVRIDSISTAQLYVLGYLEFYLILDLCPRKDMERNY